MIETALRAVLMTTVSAAPLFPQGSDATPRTAITLTPITGAANNENRVACAASLLPENNLAPLRHPGRQVGLDKNDRSWQGKTISVQNLMVTSLRGCQAGVSPLEAVDPRVVFPPFKTTYITTQVWKMIDRGDVRLPAQMIIIIPALRPAGC
jgi:hypothetical protein